MNEPLISVGMAAYNHGAYIGYALESVLNQQDVTTEIIVVDDASSDNTAEVVETFMRRDPRIRLIRHPRNLGPSMACQSYLRDARGDYIAVLPTDDALAPGKLRKQLDYFEQHPNTGMVTSGVTFIDEANAHITSGHFAGHLFDTVARTRHEWLNHFFVTGNTICATGVMLKTDIYRKHATPDMRYMQLQDYDQWMRVVLAGYDIGVIDEKLALYRIRDGAANLSAPGMASLAGSMYECTHILRRYWSLTDAAELAAIFPHISPKLPDGVTEKAYIYHSLASTAWALGTPQHRSFALESWFTLLEAPVMIDSALALGVDARFLRQKTAQNPLALALRWTPAFIARQAALRWLPASTQQYARRIYQSARQRRLSPSPPA
jgi:glycosyltransferase involved in cell wall biosynthesis